MQLWFDITTKDLLADYLPLLGIRETFRFIYFMDILWISMGVEFLTL
jgi:hypothetical protein